MGERVGRFAQNACERHNAEGRGDEYRCLGRVDEFENDREGDENEKQIHPTLGIGEKFSERASVDLFHLPFFSARLLTMIPMIVPSKPISATTIAPELLAMDCRI